MPGKSDLRTQPAKEKYMKSKRANTVQEIKWFYKLSPSNVLCETMIFSLKMERNLYLAYVWNIEVPYQIYTFL